MKKLATKRTNKSIKSNKKHLAKKLNNLAKKVAKKNVFVVERADPSYNLINYVTKEVLLENIPFLKSANSMCKILNKTQEYATIRGAQRHIDTYYKHYNDLQFYKHTVRTSNDKVKVFSAGVRMQESLHFIKEAKLHLSYF